MKLRNYKDYTFKICMAWCNVPSPKNTSRLIANLRRWARFTGYGNDPDMGYRRKDDKSLYWHVHYCSDRMTNGRAKALLRLVDEEYAVKEKKRDRAFRTLETNLLDFIK